MTKYRSYTQIEMLLEAAASKQVFLKFQLESALALLTPEHVVVMNHATFANFASRVGTKDFACSFDYDPVTKFERLSTGMVGIVNGAVLYVPEYDTNYADDIEEDIVVYKLNDTSVLIEEG